MTLDQRAHAPATARNREAILAVLREILPSASPRTKQTAQSVPTSQPLARGASQTAQSVPASDPLAQDAQQPAQSVPASDSLAQGASQTAPRSVDSACNTVLEIGSGSGEHVVYFAPHFPHLDWQPSETNQVGLRSIEAWLAHTRADNILPPITLDATVRPWPVGRAAAILAINVIHYSPWETTSALLDGAAKTLIDGGVLYLYGPYRRAGVETAPSNEAFDGWLKARNPAFGVRDLQAVESLAKERGLSMERVIEMPANNLSVVFRRKP